MGRRLALLVATARYSDGKLPNLRAPVQETQKLQQLLEDPSIGGFEPIPVLLDNRKPVIEYEMEKLFADCSPDDLVLLYISGHGLKSSDNQLFFATNDTECDRPYSTAVPAIVVQHLLHECQARNKAVLLDCCYSGMFTRMPMAKSDNRVVLDDSLGKGTYIMTATSALHRAYEDEKLVLNQPQPYSIFTDAVLKGLSGGVAARTGGDIITAEDLYSYVFDELKRRDDSNRIQLPNRFNSAEGSFKIANVKSRRLIVDEFAQPPQLQDFLSEMADRSCLSTPIGQAYQVDRNTDDIVRLDFANQARHVGVVGKIHSGKSVLVRTVLEGLTARYQAEDVMFYCLDASGQFVNLIGHNRVREVVSPYEGAKVTRCLSEIDTIIAQRDRLFRAAHVRNVAQFRRLREMDKLPPGNNGDIFLIIDGWDQFSQEVPDLPHTVRRIASAGLDKGVHVVITARHWSEIPPEVDRLLQARVELVLPDPTESKIDPDLSATLPDRPGWGLYDGTRFLTALPRAAESDDDLQSVIDKLETALIGDVAEVITYEEVLKSDTKRNTKLVPIGVDEESRQPVYLDFAADSHFYAFADGESGKTNLLRQITRGITERYTTQEAVIILVDYRRTMLGFDGDQLLGYAVSAAQLQSMVKDVHGSMCKRLPGPDVTHEQLKTRSWWTGPELFIIIDDYDLVATQTNNPLEPLTEFLAQSKDVGLHLVIARRTGGGAKAALNDAVISKLGELRVPGMVMNGSPSEGALIGDLEPAELPPGRGALFNLRRGTQGVRVAWTDPNIKLPEEPGKQVQATE